MPFVQKNNKKGIIVGCGIAGPALAIFLHRIGVDAEVYERRNAPSDFGVLTLTSNCIRILKLLEIYDKLQVDDNFKMLFYSGNGKFLSTLNYGSEIKKQNQDGAILVKRKLLSQTLIDKAKFHGIKINFGKELVKIEESENKITAFFEDRTTTEGDFLIGCDGLHSKTRTIIHPNGPFPKYTGSVAIGAEINDSNEYELSPNTAHLTVAKHAFFGIFGLQDSIVWSEILPYPEIGLDEFKTMSSKQLTEKLFELHKDDDKKILHHIVAAKNNYVKIPIYDLLHLPTWHKNSICLIGDAAHATSPEAGQGASMSIEDSAVLAMCIRDIPNLEQAFSTFENLRKNRTEKIVKLAHDNLNNLTISNPAKKFFRNILLQFFLKRFSITNTNWIFSYKIDWNKKIIPKTV